MKYTTLIVTLLALLLVISLARAEWELLLATHNMSGVTALETDGSRLFAGGSLEGLYTSDDNGDTWCTTALTHGYVQAIAISGDAVYAFVNEHGMFRSDDYGKTWNPINDGLRTIHDHTLDIRIPYINQILVTRSDMVIAAGGFDGTYISRDRGETWHFAADWSFPCPKGPEVPDFTFSDSIDSMIEYDGYLWAAAWFHVYRSPDDGSTWECVPVLPRLGEAYDWAVLNNQLYVAGGHGFVRWNEGELAWDDLNNGLPDSPDLRSLAVNRGRIFAAVRASSMIRPGAYRTVAHGVYEFDEQSETWFPAGLEGVAVYLVASDQSYLYASTYKGIYRASIPVVQPYGKAAATWGAIKRP